MLPPMRRSKAVQAMTVYVFFLPHPFLSIFLSTVNCFSAIAHHAIRCQNIYTMIFNKLQNLIIYENVRIQNNTCPVLIHFIHQH